MTIPDRVPNLSAPKLLASEEGVHLRPWTVAGRHFEPAAAFRSKDEMAARGEDVPEEGRSLAADPAMPEALRRSLLDALREHDEIAAERAERDAAPERVREATAAARSEAGDIADRLRTGSRSGDADAMDALPARGDRLAARL